MPNLYNTVPIIDLTDVKRDPICMVLKRKCDEYITEQINYNCSQISTAIYLDAV